MTKNPFWTGMLCLTLAIGFLHTSWSQEISMEGREVLEFRQASTATASGPNQGETARFEFDLKSDVEGICWGLNVVGQRPAGGWQIEINGRDFYQHPITVDNSHWYQIAPGFLSLGVNTITFTAPPGESLSIEGVAGFSLQDSFEEVHFNVFIEGPGIFAQPPIHPDQSKFDVQHVDLALDLPMNSLSITSGVMTMTAESLDSTLSQCVLDFNDNGGLMSVSAVDDGFGTPLTYTHIGAEDRLYITLPAAVPIGNIFTVRVTYGGTPPNLPDGNDEDDAFEYDVRPSGAPIVYTESQAYRARDWWPCKDIIADKFTCDMHITVPDASYSGYPLFAVCNGALVSTVDNGTTLTYNWSESYPIASQYVSVTATNFRASTGTYLAQDGFTTMDMAHYVWPESYASEAAAITATIDVMDFFSETFGEYPFLTEKYWTATWGQGYGMEHQTCTSINNGNLVDGYSRRNIHELAHMWFGVCVGVENFDHLWLSEGWATYCEPLFYEYQSGTAAYHSYINAWSTSDTYPIISSSADNFNTSIVYRKGAWVLHMLRHVIGDADFFQAASNFIADSSLAYGTAVTDDFEAHVEAVAGQQLDWFFDQWLLRASRPDYDWAWDWHLDGSDAVIDIYIEQTQSDDVYIMPIDLNVDLQGGGSQLITVQSDKRRQTFEVNIGPVTPTDVDFDPDNWVLAFETEVAFPHSAAVIGGGAGSTTVRWAPTGGGGGYRLYQSADGMSGWTLIQGEGTLVDGVLSTAVSGLPLYTDVYFRVTELDTSPTPVEGPPSDVMGVRLGSGSAPLLIVDGYDRWDGQTAVNPTGANHDFIADHGRAVGAYGTPFDSCANESVGTLVNLTDYEIVVWICGDESTVDETFSSDEQALIEEFLEGGGKLLVSGNEIGWDLGRVTQPAADQAFYHDYLRADFVMDDSGGDLTVDGTGGASAFGTTAFSFGGGDTPYFPEFPDVIDANGSTAALQYSAGNVAAIQYSGTFGSSATSGMLVYLAFAFETLSSESERVALMDDVLTWFGAPVPADLTVFGISLY